jgi:ABC-type bacteriocin/lantibiotic exporter with double-glycine peptidase domain
MLKLKLFKQSKGYCGPASLKMVLSAYRINKSENYLAKLAHANRKKGCSGKNMVNAAKKLGFKAYLKKRSSINELKKFSKKRIPVIVAWKSPEEGGHYSVVVGFEKNRILLADPHFGKIKKQDIKWFDKKWKEIINKKKKIRRGAIIMYK